MNSLAKCLIIATKYTVKMFDMKIAKKHHKSSAYNNCIILIAFSRFKMTLKHWGSWVTWFPNGNWFLSLAASGHQPNLLIQQRDDPVWPSSNHSQNDLLNREWDGAEGGGVAHDACCLSHRRLPHSTGCGTGQLLTNLCPLRFTQFYTSMLIHTMLYHSFLM